MVALRSERAAEPGMSTQVGLAEEMVTVDYSLLSQQLSLRWKELFRRRFGSCLRSVWGRLQRGRRQVREVADEPRLSLQMRLGRCTTFAPGSTF